MTKVEILKKKSELAALYAAKINMEFKIAEYEENIERLKQQILLQGEAIKRIENELKGVEGNG